ncbi:hypothetical protein A6R68_01371, partial [Neotoma lepida]
MEAEEKKEKVAKGEEDEEEEEGEEVGPPAHSSSPHVEANEMDQTPPARSEPLVSGIRTPPVRRNSKLATLGRIFKPWKWRKKKTEKLKQTTSALEKKMAGRQGREELIKQGLLEMMEQGKWDQSAARGAPLRSTALMAPVALRPDFIARQLRRLQRDSESKVCSPSKGSQPAQSEPSTAEQETLTSEDVQPGSPLASGTDQASQDELLSSDAHLDDTAKMPSASSVEEAEADSLLPTTDELSQALAGSDSPDSPPRPLERSASQLPSPPLLPTPPPKASCKATKTVTGQATLFQGPGMKSNEPALRGQLATPTGSPHLTTVHRPLPPSRVIEELHRALATKHRQDRAQCRAKYYKARSPGFCSKLSAQGAQDQAEKSFRATTSGVSTRSYIDSYGFPANPWEVKQELRCSEKEPAMQEELRAGGRVGTKTGQAWPYYSRRTLPRKCKKELLAVKLRNRPSKQELEDRNIFPRRTDEERQEIRQQIEMKLSKRLSQRPAVEELERRNILKPSRRMGDMHVQAHIPSLRHEGHSFQKKEESPPSLLLNLLTNGLEHDLKAQRPTLKSRLYALPKQ